MPHRFSRARTRGDDDLQRARFGCVLCEKGVELPRRGAGMCGRGRDENEREQCAPDRLRSNCHPATPLCVSTPPIATRAPPDDKVISLSRAQAMNCAPTGKEIGLQKQWKGCGMAHPPRRVVWITRCRAGAYRLNAANGRPWNACTRKGHGSRYRDPFIDARNSAFVLVLPIFDSSSSM